MCGFETPDSGQIFLDGRDISDDNIRTRARRIGYVMQNPNQMISKTMIFDEVALGLVHSGMPADQVRARVEDTLKICGLYPFRNWPISALSFGQKKRVTIASVLALGPEVIILDEPTAGQDFHHYTEIMEFLRGLNEQGVTVLMITHDMHLMLEYTPPGAGIQRRAPDRRQERRRGALRSGAGGTGGAERNQPVHPGGPLRHRPAGTVCPAVH